VYTSIHIYIYSREEGKEKRGGRKREEIFLEISGA